jgi:hypothetical protein
MELYELYQFVLLIVVVGMLLGVGILALDTFSTSSGVTATAATAINNVRAALATIASNWLTLIITIVVLSIIIVVVVRSFGFGGGVGGRR